MSLHSFNAEVRLDVRVIMFALRLGRHKGLMVFGRHIMNGIDIPVLETDVHRTIHRVVARTVNMTTADRLKAFKTVMRRHYFLCNFLKFKYRNPSPNPAKHTVAILVPFVKY